MSRRLLWILVPVVVIAAGVGIWQLQAARTPDHRISGALRERLKGDPPALPAANRGEADRAWAALQRFYEERRYRAAFLDGRGATPKARELTEELARAGREGLMPAEYDADSLAAAIERLEPGLIPGDPPAPETLADLEIRLAQAMMRYADHLANGRVRRSDLRPDWKAAVRDSELVPEMLEAVSGGSISKQLQAIAPQHPGYKQLRDALMRYAKVVSDGGWGPLPAGANPRPGSQGTAVAALRRRLAASGDLSDTSGTPVYDDQVKQAVMLFQRRHGLEPTGVVDDATRKELDRPAAERLRRMQLNLERWRWIPDDLGKAYVSVNIPDFRLEVVENGKPVRSMKVVAGKTRTPTPIFSDKITYVEFNPYWNVPNSIATEEILPKVVADPGYLAANNIEVLASPGNEAEALDPSSVDWQAYAGGESFPYAFRQRPGSQNPLGRIKFMFPNQFNIYLHDTPADHLFSRDERGFSHGCIRVEKPLELATYVLRGTEFAELSRIRSQLDSGERKAVPLPQDLPVYILYWTAWADEQGRVHFREDLYGYDEELNEVMKRFERVAAKPAKAKRRRT